MSSAKSVRLPSDIHPFTEVIDRIRSYSAEDLVGRERLGATFSFESERMSFIFLFELMDRIDRTDFSGVPDFLLPGVNQLLYELAATLTTLNNFTPGHGGDPTTLRSGFQQQFRRIFKDLFTAIGPILDFCDRRSTDISELRQQMELALAELRTQVAQQKEVVEKSEGLLETQKKFLEDTGVTYFAKLFNDEARSHLWAGRAWLVATGAFAIIAGKLAYHNYLETQQQLLTALRQVPNPSGGMPTAFIVQFAIAKLMLLSLALSAIFWMARIYKSHTHNYIVNRHRANALRSFETFVKSSGDRDTRSAVLLQTTTCIYSPQSTGYVSSESESDSPLKVLEVVRNLQK